MKDSLVLHCDPTGRPYRFEDFLRPLEELGLLECVAGFGGFQFNHVWLLRLSTSADRRVLLEAGSITVKDKHCAVVDPCRREVCAKVHWVPFSVTDDALKEAFNDYGEVSDVSRVPLRSSGFEVSDSTTRLVRLCLKEGTDVDDLPHLLPFHTGVLLVVVAGRSPLCLRCKKTGHVRKECRTARCTHCRSFGHASDRCSRSHEQFAAGDAAFKDDKTEFLMDAEEVESTLTSFPENSSLPSTERPFRIPGDRQPVRGTPPTSTCSGITEPKREGNVNAAAQAEVSGNTKAVQVARPQPLNEATPLVKPCLGQGTSTERLEATTAKRRREYGNDAITEQRLRQLERQWVLAPGRRIMCASNGRSPSCSRGGGRFSL